MLRIYTSLVHFRGRVSKHRQVCDNAVSACSRLQNIRESASRKVARKSRGSWRVSIVFNTSFRYTSSWYTLYDWSILTIYVKHINRIGLSASCSRFSKTFPGISQKVAQKTIKSCFLWRKSSKVARKNKTFLGLMLKYTNCTTKVRFLSIFCNFVA